MSRWPVRTFEERFDSHVNKTDGCWLWTASTNNAGYGQIQRGDTMVLAHRASYERYCGPIPAGLGVLHHCDTRRCVRPDHLFVGTGVDNMQDALSKGRIKLPVVPVGEASPHAKIRAVDVIAIRSAERAGSETHNQFCKRLGKQFGVSRSQVFSILTRRSWRSLP